MPIDITIPLADRERIIKLFFPKRMLSEKEIAWCYLYERKTGYEVILIEEVRTKKDFIEMMKCNMRWYEAHTQERMSKIKQAFQEVIK